MNCRMITAWCVLLLLPSLGVGSALADSPDTILWYRGPATTWVEALPIGNDPLKQYMLSDDTD